MFFTQRKNCYFLELFTERIFGEQKQTIYLYDIIVKAPVGTFIFEY